MRVRETLGVSPRPGRRLDTLARYSVGGSSVADWTVDAAGTPNRCEALDTDPWRAVPVAAATVAHTTSSGQTGTADIVFGVRAASATPAGRYRAKVRVEVIAPWA